jgi:hypothetical protein
MKNDMKQRYSVFLRPWGVYYCQDNTNGQQETLKTRDKDEAFRLVAAKNENEEAPAFSLHLARVPEEKTPELLVRKGVNPSTIFLIEPARVTKSSGR